MTLKKMIHLMFISKYLISLISLLVEIKIQNIKK